MTDTTTTPTLAPTPAAPTPAPATDTLHAQLAALQADNALLAKSASEQATALAAALRERDALKAQVGELAPRAKVADELTLKVAGFENAARESAIVDTLRAKLPGAEPLAVRGVLAQLAEQGKANRFAEDAAAEAAKVLALISTEAPSLTRPPTSGGGSPGARQTPPPPRLSLMRG